MPLLFLPYNLLYSLGAVILNLISLLESFSTGYLSSAVASPPLLKSLLQPGSVFNSQSSVFLFSDRMVFLSFLYGALYFCYYDFISFFFCFDF